MIWIPCEYLADNVAVLAPDELRDVVEHGLDTLRSIFNPDRGRDQYYEMFQSRPGWLRSYVARAEQELQCHGYDPNPGPTQSFIHFMRMGLSTSPAPPNWLGTKHFHMSQCSLLIAQNPVYYAHRLPLNTPLELPEIWP